MSTPQSAPKESRQAKIMPVIGILAFILPVSAGYYFHNNTLVSWWLPIEVAVVAALVSLPAACRLFRLQPLFSKIVYTIFASGVFYFLVLALNSAGLDTSTAVEHELMVVNKFEKLHRVRRPHSSITRQHYTYHIVLRDKTGRDFNIQTEKSRYFQIPVHRPLKVQLTKGRLGFSVIDRI